MLWVQKLQVKLLFCFLMNKVLYLMLRTQQNSRCTLFRSSVYYTNIIIHTYMYVRTSGYVFIFDDFVIYFRRRRRLDPDQERLLQPSQEAWGWGESKDCHLRHQVECQQGRAHRWWSSTSKIISLNFPWEITLS